MRLRLDFASGGLWAATVACVRWELLLLATKLNPKKQGCVIQSNYSGWRKICGSAKRLLFIQDAEAFFAADFGSNS